MWNKAPRFVEAEIDAYIERKIAERDDPARAAEQRERVQRWVESRMGAVAWGNLPTLRFPSPLIKPDVPNYGIRLSD